MSIDEQKRITLLLLEPTARRYLFTTSSNTKVGSDTYKTSISSVAIPAQLKNMIMNDEFIINRTNISSSNNSTWIVSLPSLDQWNTIQQQKHCIIYKVLLIIHKHLLLRDRSISNNNRSLCSVTDNNGPIPILATIGLLLTGTYPQLYDNLYMLTEKQKNEIFYHLSVHRPQGNQHITSTIKNTVISPLVLVTHCCTSFSELYKSVLDILTPSDDQILFGISDIHPINNSNDIRMDSFSTVQRELKNSINLCPQLRRQTTNDVLLVNTTNNENKLTTTNQETVFNLSTTPRLLFNLLRRYNKISQQEWFNRFRKYYYQNYFTNERILDSDNFHEMFLKGIGTLCVLGLIRENSSIQQQSNTSSGYSRTGFIKTTSTILG